MLKDQSVSTLTLEEALKLFEFPRNIGEFEGKDVTVAIGRFGPYVKHDGKFVSIPSDIAPASISLPQAIELIETKRQATSKRIIKAFDEDPDLQVLDGRYGAYIAYNKANYKLPKTVSDPSALTIEECREIIASQADKPKKPARRTASRKK